jgi:glucose/mannose transport system substrate-binding protein
MTMFKKLHMTAAVLALSTTAVAAQEVEVLHWWTSGGEAAAVGTLRDALADGGVGWVDMPVAGGGGSDAMTVLRARVTAGDPPTAVQMLGFSIQDWAAEGALANLNDLAAEQGWADVVPAALQRFSTYDGNWVAAPVNVHSTNWVWANTALMEELGIEQPTAGTSSSRPCRRRRMPATPRSPMVVRPGRTPRSSTRWSWASADPTSTRRRWSISTPRRSAPT